jgi:hypothetical protein
MVRILFLISLVLLAACEPVLIFSGGKLDGTTAAVPDDWSFTDAVNTVQLETNPDDPYSVNIWVIAIGETLYVHAGANRAAWVEDIEADADVTIRVDQTLYPLRASRVEDAAEFARFSAAYEQKYERRPRNENVAEAYLFRLTARD